MKVDDIGQVIDHALDEVPGGAAARVSKLYPQAQRQAAPPPPPLAQWVAVAQAWQPPDDLATRQVQVQFAVQPLIQAGLVGALVAAGGTGKTTLLLTLGIHIAIGRPWMDMAVTPGTFVLLSSDDAQEDLETALALVVRALRLTPNDVDLVQRKVRIVSLQGLDGTKTFATIAGGSTMATGLEDLLLQAVEGIDDLVGIALDTLRQFSGGNSNDEQVIKLTIAGAAEVALKTGAFIILPHHTGKQNYRDGVVDMYCGSGSAAIADNCRFVLLLQTTTWADIEGKVRRTGQERGDPLVLTSTRGSLLVKAPAPLFLHRDGFYIGQLAGTVLTAQEQFDEKDRAILWAVRKGAQSKNAIALVVKGNRKATLDRIDDLEIRGLLQRSTESSTGKLMLSVVGSRFLDASQ